MLAIALSLLFGVIAFLAVIEIWASGRKGWHGARSIRAELVSAGGSTARARRIRSVSPLPRSSKRPVRQFAAA
jgi:hypothetical protein